MREQWVAALAINLTLGLCFICCLRLFNLCIRYAGALKEFYHGDDALDYDEEDGQSERQQSNILEVENIRKLRAVRAQQIAGSRRMWLPRSMSAYLTLFTLLVDCSAFAAFSFSSSTPIASSKTKSLSEMFVTLVRSIAKAFLFQFTDESFEWTFWVALSLAAITIPVGIFVLVKDSRENSLPNLTFQVLGVVLLFPICSTLTGILSCTYPKHDGDFEPHLAALPTLICWSSEHQRMVGAAMVVFVLYYILDALLLARLIRSIIDESDFAEREGATAIYTDNRFMVFYFQAKVCVSFVVSYWGTGDYSSWIVILAIFVLLCGLIAYNYIARPSNVDVLNSMRTYTLSFALVINACAIVSVASQNWNMIGHWLVFAGVLLWFVCVLFHFCTEYGWMECRMFEPDADGDMSESLMSAAAFCNPDGQPSQVPDGLISPELATVNCMTPAPVQPGVSGFALPPPGSKHGHHGSLYSSPAAGGVSAAAAGGQIGVGGSPGPGGVGGADNQRLNAGSVTSRPSTSRVVYVNLSSSGKDSIVLI